MAGYYGYSMSNNAKECYDNDVMPLSKWTKSLILEKVKEYDDKFYEILKKVSVSVLKSYLLTYNSWHHTSSRYNKTNFYSFNDYYLDEERINIILDKQIKYKNSKSLKNKEVIKDKKEEIEITVCYAVWGGSRKYPKIVDHVTRTGIKKNDYVVFKDGTKKMLSGKYIEIIK